MAAASVHDDHPVLTAVSWEDRSWWSGALNRETVIDYFSHSQFYDRTCLNEQLKMQRDLPRDVALQRLRELPGIVYRLDETRTEERPPTETTAAQTLYVIQKLSRDNRGVESTLRYYYVLNGVVFEAPTIAAIVRARLLRLGFYLKDAFDMANPKHDRRANQRDGSSKRARKPNPGAGP